MMRAAPVLRAGVLLLASVAIARADDPTAELVNPYRIMGVSLEYPHLDEYAMRKIAMAVGAEEVHQPRGLLYRLRGGVEATHLFRLAVDSLRVDAGSTLQVIRGGRLEAWNFSEPRAVYLYGVQSGSLFAPAAARELGNFLTSSYLLETGEVNTRGGQYLMNPEPRPDREFWRRNLISQGWGAQYIYTENPYAKNGWLPIGFGYLIDAASAALVVMGPVTGKTVPEKLGPVAGGVAFSLFFKLLLNAGVAKGHLNIYNRIVNSGYPVPRPTSWWTFRKVRFGEYDDTEPVIVEIGREPI